MAKYAQTLEEELAKRGKIGSYSWKPNLLFAKRGNRYEPADVVSDGSASEVAAAVEAKGQEKLGEVGAVAAAQKALIAANERDYNAVRRSLLQTYKRMSDYFQYHNMLELKETIDAAILELQGGVNDA